MASWNEVVQRVSRELDVELSGDAEFTVNIRRQDHTGAREQLVVVSHYRSWGREMIEIRSAFGEASRYDSDKLLEDNLNLPLGAVARHGRYLVLVHKACLEDLSATGVMFLLTQLGLLADVLEGRTGEDLF